MTTAAGASILIVKDEMLVRLFAVDALQDAGFHVEQAGEAEEALRWLTHGPAALQAAIVDLGLPDRCGDQLALQMRALQADLPIVIASGRSEKELKERFDSDCRVAVLGKPYTASMLLDALASLGVKAART